MQIINNTGAIIKEQINLGDIDNLNIDDLFKDNTNNKKMKNNNYPNWLVPIEIAKELKEIGFDLPCAFVLTNKDRLGFTTEGEGNYHLFDDLDLNSNSESSLVCIPTYEQVFEWFREKGFDSYIGLENLPYPNEGIYYYFEISKPNLYRINQLDLKGEFDDYEEAREALVKALIRTYKNEQL